MTNNEFGSVKNWKLWQQCGIARAKNDIGRHKTVLQKTRNEQHSGICYYTQVEKLRPIHWVYFIVIIVK